MPHCVRHTPQRRRHREKRDRTSPPLYLPFPTERFEARLAALSWEELLELAAQQCCASPVARSVCDELLAAREPLPQWAVENVLLEAPLLARIVGFLGAEDGAVASVCTRWSHARSADLAERRIIHPIRTLSSAHLKLDKPIDVIALPNKDTGGVGPKLLAITNRNSNEVLIVDQDLNIMHRLGAPPQPALSGPCALASTEDSLYVSEACTPARIRRFNPHTYWELYACTSPAHNSFDDLGARRPQRDGACLPRARA